MSAQIGWLEEPENNYAALVVVDEASGDTFEIQRPLLYVQNDDDPQANHYCLVRNGATVYGGLRSIKLDGVSLTVGLSDEAADTLQLPPAFTIGIRASDMQLLREKLPEFAALASGSE